MAQRTHHQAVSPELDELSCTLMGEALDRLAEGADVNVLLVVGDAAGQVATYEFADDGEEVCLTAARERVRALHRSQGDAQMGLGMPCYYALCYEGSVASETEGFSDALLMEFGEQGHPAYSAFSYFKGRGTGDAFAWTDPAPAGEVESLL
jgi:hypothetical protein